MLSLVLQIIFVEFGGTTLGTVGLSAVQWFSCVALAVSILVVGALVRAFIPVPQWKWLKYDVPFKFSLFKRRGDYSGLSQV